MALVINTKNKSDDTHWFYEIPLVWFDQWRSTRTDISYASAQLHNTDVSSFTDDLRLIHIYLEKYPYTNFYHKKSEPL